MPRKRASSAARMVGSSERVRVWKERRRERVSWVMVGRVGVCGPEVVRMRVRVWRKRVRRWGMKKGLCEGAVELDGLSLERQRYHNGCRRGELTMRTGSSSPRIGP